MERLEGDKRRGGMARVPPTKNGLRFLRSQRPPTTVTGMMPKLFFPLPSEATGTNASSPGPWRLAWPGAYLTTAFGATPSTKLNAAPRAYLRYTLAEDRCAEAQQAFRRE